MGVKRNSGTLNAAEEPRWLATRQAKSGVRKCNRVVRDKDSDIADHVGYMTAQYMPHVATTRRRLLIASMTDSGGSAVKGVAASSSQGRGLENSGILGKIQVQGTLVWLGGARCAHAGDGNAAKNTTYGEKAFLK